MTGTTSATTNTATTMEQQNTSHFKLTPTSCGTCSVHFDTAETRRAHSKSQWHVTNLKRRIADLEPLTAEQHAATHPEDPTDSSGPTIGPEPEESSSDAELSDASAELEVEFVPEECIFCNTSSESFDGNLEHMQKTHGMFIPDKERLIVDLETLVRYLHLVVFGYRECLQCGTQRRTPAAVQQHMRGKNHCRFDITAEDSEFKDFYDESAADEDAPGQTRKAISDAAEDGGSIRLPSGKLLSHRTDPAASRPKVRTGTATNGDNLLPEGSEDVDESKASFQLTAPSAKKHPDYKSLTRAEKRDVDFETQLSRLSVTDRAALAHLPAAEQRNVLLTQQKQLQKAERAARRQQTRLEMKMNKAGQGRFVNDVPGRKNG